MPKEMSVSEIKKVFNIWLNENGYKFNWKRVDKDAVVHYSNNDEEIYAYVIHISSILRIDQSFGIPLRVINYLLNHDEITRLFVIHWSVSPVAHIRMLLLKYIDLNELVNQSNRGKSGQIQIPLIRFLHVDTLMPD